MAHTMRYSHAQKAVAAIVAIGKPKAAELLKHLTRSEISKLMAVAKTMSAVTQDGLELIVSEFESEFTRGSGLVDSSVQMESILVETFDETELASMRGESKTQAPIKEKKLSAWEVLEKIDPPLISSYLESENAQVGAYVLSRLPSEKAAEILTLMDRDARSSILGRMMSLSDVSDQAEQFLQGELLEQFGQEKKSNSKNALIRVATILNEMDRDATEEMLGELSFVVEAGEVSAVKSLLFRFDDIIALEASARTLIFDAIATDTLTFALREASVDLTESILSSISQRTRRMIESDLKSKSQVRAVDIATARKKIVSAVLKLSGDGRIELPKQKLEAA
jgi:flagellar motor switch protein FliG